MFYIMIMYVHVVYYIFYMAYISGGVLLFRGGSVVLHIEFNTFIYITCVKILYGVPLHTG